jgi:FdhD protein
LKANTSSVSRRSALKWRSGASASESESLAVEEPLEIRLGGRRFVVTMRTPGHDEELATGFLLGEGFIDSQVDICEIRRPRAGGRPEPNKVDVILRVPAAQLRERLRRNVITSSSCGICGMERIESIRRRVAPLRDSAKMPATLLVELGPRMRDAQPIFAETGGLHAAALFDLCGNLRLVREDVGRHNAVDKVIGHAVIERAIPLLDAAMMVSGRLSFEIVQKAAAAGIPIVTAVSAPSSLAAELADEIGMTLVGFVRESGFNIYSHPERIAE